MILSVKLCSILGLYNGKIDTSLLSYPEFNWLNYHWTFILSKFSGSANKTKELYSFQSVEFLQCAPFVVGNCLHRCFSGTLICTCDVDTVLHYQHSSKRVIHGLNFSMQALLPGISLQHSLQARWRIDVSDPWHLGVQL